MIAVTIKCNNCNKKIQGATEHEIRRRALLEGWCQAVYADYCGECWGRSGPGDGEIPSSVAAVKREQEQNDDQADN